MNNLTPRRLTRRTALRGMLGGAAISVGVPFLDCFLNTNGTALASGAPMPKRFGTWFWCLGVNPQRWAPANAGPGYDLAPELQEIKDIKDDVNVFSGYNVLIDGRQNIVHYTGIYGLLTGICPANGDSIDAPTMDILIGEQIGTGTRFKSVELTATADPKMSYSRRTFSDFNPAEPSPVAFYTRVFGADFQDPNSANFKPDPKVMLRHSVLSAAREDRDRLIKQVGATDRERLDQYFTSVRQLEQQLEIQLQKPPPAEACKIPGKVTEAPIGQEVDNMQANNKLHAQLIAMALACNQTKVFNFVLSDQSLRRVGATTTFHTNTHEEPTDPVLGYQPEVTYFIGQGMKAWAEFVKQIKAVPEGAGTLLDNTLVFAHSDVSMARAHGLNSIPMMTAGKAGGRMKSGIHVKGNGDAVTRVGFTLMQIMGVPVDKWGTNSMQTNKEISEILA